MSGMYKKAKFSIWIPFLKAAFFDKTGWPWLDCRSLSYHTSVCFCFDFYLNRASRIQYRSICLLSSVHRKPVDYRVLNEYAVTRVYEKDRTLCVKEDKGGKWQVIGGMSSVTNDI